MKRKRQTIDNIRNEYNRIAKFLNARSLAKLRATSKSHGLAKAAGNETGRRAANIASSFTPAVRAMEVFVHEIAVMLKRTRYANPQALKQAIAARSRAHPDVITHLEIIHFDNDERDLYITMSPKVTYPVSKGRFRMALKFAITFPANTAVMANEFRLHVDIPSCTVMIPMTVDRAAAAATAHTLRSMRPKWDGSAPYVDVLVRKVFPKYTPTPGELEPLTAAHLVARYALLGEDVWARSMRPANGRAETMRRLTMIAADHGPVEFPIMVDAIARLFNRHVAVGIVRQLGSILKSHSRTARSLIQSQKAYEVFERGFFVSPGIPEVYTILRQRARAGRPQILSAADIASLSPRLQKKIARLKG